MIKKLSVMLIDDNEFDLFMVTKFLEIKKISSNISKFEYADKALKYLNETEAAQWPDLIFLDIHMPLINGFEFLRRYDAIPEEKRQKAHIIMVSSTLDLGDNKNAIENPSVLALLNKPLNMDELVELLIEKGIFEYEL